MLIELDERQNHITIRRERPATKAERSVDHEAFVRTEVITIQFSSCGDPMIKVQSDLCSK